jgi:hypothetical protein
VIRQAIALGLQSHGSNRSYDDFLADLADW